MSEKLSAVLTVRMLPGIKDVLQSEASKVGWTTSQLALTILSEWVNNVDSSGGAISFILRNCSRE